MVGPDRLAGRLRSRLGEAKIFWHAAGFGQDEDIAAERCEHFGTVTMEAMAAVSVPVVIRKGGQPEVVEHGVSGFLWDTVGEIEASTRLLIDDDELRQGMSAATVVRAQHFSRATFESEMLRRVTSYWEIMVWRRPIGEHSTKPGSNDLVSDLP